MPELSTTKMSSKGQVIIPEDIQKKLGLKAGSQFVVVGEKDTVILKTILPSLMEDFDHLITKARKQAAKIGIKRSGTAAAISKARGHKRK